jgi:hypothetical protein
MKTVVSHPVPGTEIALPVITVQGARPGKTLLVSAGVHGDEFEGIQAIFDVVEALDPAEMSGSLVAVPVANPPAFWNVSRTSPLDDGNLARVFPGNPDGATTERIAACFDRDILSRADFYLDLHSGGIKWAMPTLVGFSAANQLAREAAAIFGAPAIWAHDTIAPGRTISAALDRGIPALYAEARGGGRIHPEDLALYRRGILQLLRHLEILPGPAQAVPPALQLAGDGNIDAGFVASQRGFLTSLVGLLDFVLPGDELGILRDLCGRTLDVITAPRAGVVVLIHACPTVHPGEPLFLLTDRIS